MVEVLMEEVPMALGPGGLIFQNSLCVAELLLPVLMSCWGYG